MSNSQRNKLILKIIASVIVLVYLLNCCTPLRLHIDMLRYFAIKDCIELGCPPNSDAAKDYMPVGYTAMLIILSKLGILKSYTIVLINCIYLFGSLALVIRIFPSSTNAFLFLFLVLLNWTIIKFITHPLSELQYMFFSISSLYSFHRYTQQKKYFWLLVSFSLGALAFLTRSVGISLFAALITSLLWQYRKELFNLIKKNRILVLVILLAAVGVLVFSKQLGLNHYTGVFSKQFQGGLTLYAVIKGHFIEWAEICLNFSIVKVPAFLSVSSINVIFFIAGVFFFVGFVYLCFLRKNNIPFILKAYAFFYCLLMFNWPFYDPRFWVPLLPLVAGVVAYDFPILDHLKIEASRKQNFSKTKLFISLIAGVYFLIGAISVGYITYTSLNRKVLARTQANGVYKNEYETFFYGSDVKRPADSNVVNILRRYDR